MARKIPVTITLDTPKPTKLKQGIYSRDSVELVVTIKENGQVKKLSNPIFKCYPQFYKTGEKLPMLPNECFRLLNEESFCLYLAPLMTQSAENDILQLQILINDNNDICEHGSTHYCCPPIMLSVNKNICDGDDMIEMHVLSTENGYIVLADDDKMIEI